MDIRIRPNITTMNWIDTSYQHVLSQIEDLFDEESYKHFLMSIEWRTKEQDLFNDVVYCKRLHLDELVCLLLIGDVQIGKTFSFKLIVQSRIGFWFTNNKNLFLYGFYWEINF
jgi:hypothetical protein